MAVIEAAVSEMAHMGQPRFDGALKASLDTLRVEGGGAAGAAAAAMEPGGALRSLSAWLQATFSPGMRQAAAEAFTEPAERAATYKRRFRQPSLYDPPSQTPPPLRSLSRLAQPASSPIRPGGAIHAAVDMAAVQSDGSSSQAEQALMGGTSSWPPNPAIGSGSSLAHHDASTHARCCERTAHGWRWAGPPGHALSHTSASSGP